MPDRTEAQSSKAEELVDAAIADGRVPLPHRASYLRAFGVDFDAAADTLASRQPNALVSSRNYYAIDEREDEYRAQAGRRLGIDPRAVI